MKRITFLAIVLLAFAFPAHAQDAMKKDAMEKDAAVKPADPELKVVLDSWNEIGRKLTAMAEDFPEDKSDFKPTPAGTELRRAVAARGRSQLLLHESCHGEGASGCRRSEARPIQVQGRYRCVRQDPSPMARPPSSRKAKKAWRRRLSISLARNRAFSTLHTASSNIAVNTTASSLCTTASQALCRRSRAQEVELKRPGDYGDWHR